MGDKLVTLLSHCNDAITSMIYSGISGGRLHKREIYVGSTFDSTRRM